MSSFKIASWNVNSLRVRLPQVLKWLETQQPDMVGLQETKVEDKDFPTAELAAAGYHLVYAGQKAYNGVALLSRQPISEWVAQWPGSTDPQQRILRATINGVRVINLYAPNGASVDSDKYHYKLNWYANLWLCLQAELALYPALVVLGDFNIAPEDRDVYAPAEWEGNVLVSPLERLAWRNLLALGLHDTFRLLEPGDGHYSWWDYRSGAFRRNQGLRIDHILSSAALSTRCQECAIDKLPRSWDRPSDHAPVLATFS